MGKITITFQDDQVAAVTPKGAFRYLIIGTAPWIECTDCKRVIPDKSICPCKGGHDPMRRLLRD